jgi:hypothetical protein
MVDVRYWHLADMRMRRRMSASGGKPDHSDTPQQCPVMTQSGH